MKIITTRLNEQGEFIPCKPRHVIVLLYIKITY